MAQSQLNGPGLGMGERKKKKYYSEIGKDHKFFGPSSVRFPDHGNVLLQINLRSGLLKE